MNDLITDFPVHYYQQFDADPGLEFPSAACGGWREGRLPVNISRTALVVMHAWDLGMPAEHPGEFRAVGELAASYEVGRTVFPGLLDAVRRSPLRLFHVVGGGKYYTEYPGYQFASDLAGPSPAPPEKIAGDEVHARIQQFRADFGRIGQHNAADVAAAFRAIRFPEFAEPQDSEPIAENTHQLFALCREFGINHLIYVGFFINWCLLMSSGGMQEMARHGVICSAIREGVVAIENRESAIGRLHKEEGLWRTSLAFGLVFDVESFKNTLILLSSTRTAG